MQRKRLQVGRFYRWDGVADQLTGKLESMPLPGWKADIKRIDGTPCFVDVAKLKPCSHEDVLRACESGGCTIPKQATPQPIEPDDQ